MADIQPFRAYRYDTNRVALQDVLTQPYDKITPAMQDRYYAASPYNLIAVEKGRALPNDSPENNVYARAARKIDEWIAGKIVVQDAAPSIYVYAQEFLVPGTHTRRVRIGFIALTRLEDYDAITSSSGTSGRSRLPRPTASNCSAAHARRRASFFFCTTTRRNESTRGSSKSPAPHSPIELSDEFGVTHRLWPISDVTFAAQIQREMTDKKLVIADGHHRYETALAYRNECRARSGNAGPLAAPEFAMATLINTHSRGLTILATHRLVSRLANFDFDWFRNNLAQHFDWYSYPFANADERATAICRVPQGP